MTVSSPILTIGLSILVSAVSLDVSAFEPYVNFNYLWRKSECVDFIYLNKSEVESLAESNDLFSDLISSGTYLNYQAVYSKLNSVECWEKKHRESGITLRPFTSTKIVLTYKKPVLVLDQLCKIRSEQYYDLNDSWESPDDSWESPEIYTHDTFVGLLQNNNLQCDSLSLDHYISLGNRNVKNEFADSEVLKLLKSSDEILGIYSEKFNKDVDELILRELSLTFPRETQRSYYRFGLSENKHGRLTEEVIFEFDAFDNPLVINLRERLKNWLCKEAEHGRALDVDVDVVCAE